MEPRSLRMKALTVFTRAVGSSRGALGPGGHAPPGVCRTVFLKKGAEGGGREARLGQLDGGPCPRGSPGANSKAPTSRGPGNLPLRRPWPEGNGLQSLSAGAPRPKSPPPTDPTPGAKPRTQQEPPGTHSPSGLSEPLVTTRALRPPGIGGQRLTQKNKTESRQNLRTQTESSERKKRTS